MTYIQPITIQWSECKTRLYRRLTRKENSLATWHNIHPTNLTSDNILYDTPYIHQSHFFSSLTLYDMAYIQPITIRIQFSAWHTIHATNHTSDNTIHYTRHIQPITILYMKHHTFNQSHSSIHLHHIHDMTYIQPMAILYMTRHTSNQSHSSLHIKYENFLPKPSMQVTCLDKLKKYTGDYFCWFVFGIPLIFLQFLNL